MLDHLPELSTHIGVHTIFLVLILVGLEAVLSADNAIALAALVQGIEDDKLQKRALNLGMIAAFGMRMALVFTATWVIQYWQFELLGAAYLLWLSLQYFLSDEEEGHHHGPRFTTIWQVIPLIAVTDLAFSLDSVTTAIALANERWLVILGGVIGIVMLRAMAELFIRWLKEFVHLQDAGYITVALVGARLLVKVFNDDLAPPQWLMITVIAGVFIWGFSKRVGEDAEPVPLAEGEASPDALLGEASAAVELKDLKDLNVIK
ncbi:MAG TPA: hypothetical protein V6D19_18070 [Stenomitos sp.]